MYNNKILGFKMVFCVDEVVKDGCDLVEKYLLFCLIDLSFYD